MGSDGGDEVGAALGERVLGRIERLWVIERLPHCQAGSDEPLLPAVQRQGTQVGDQARVHLVEKPVRTVKGGDDGAFADCGTFAVEEASRSARPRLSLISRQGLACEEWLQAN